MLFQQFSYALIRTHKNHIVCKTFGFSPPIQCNSWHSDTVFLGYKVVAHYLLSFFFSCWHNLSKYIVCEFWLVSRKHFTFILQEFLVFRNDQHSSELSNMVYSRNFVFWWTHHYKQLILGIPYFVGFFFGFSPNISIQFKFQILFIIYTTNFGTKLLKLNQF